MPQYTFDNSSTLVQVIMPWCRQAISCYLSKWWPRTLSPYGTTRPQWVKHVGLFFCQNVISVSNVVYYFYNIVAWNWLHWYLALLLLMAWCFSTRPSVTTVLDYAPIFPAVNGLIKTIFLGPSSPMGIPIRQWRDGLIFIMGISISVKWHLYIDNWN